MPKKINIIPIMLLLFSTGAKSAHKDDLALALRQLTTIEQLVVRANSTAGPSRYTFNTSRFSEDLEHIRSGIRDYLSPVRAQPRDLFEIKGDYRLETPDGDAK
ncbi:RAQPRD family integrative conjugative element protein [Pseudomonas sp. LRF_L74]|uniref:integrative conjugative element protein, RAQPRD family n=1 Tax=Pseudomonas sp. LRF_L74 TaxID=3369422 RepID=UPI003F5ED40F